MKNEHSAGRRAGAAGRRRLIGAMVLALATAAGSAAASPPPPPPPETFVACKITDVAKITAALKQAGIPAPQIDYIVVYSNNLPNHGQTVPGGTTGPVLCTNDARAKAATTDSDTSIPGIDILATDQALQVQYRATGNPSAPTKTLVCASYADVEKCKTISPK